MFFVLITSGWYKVRVFMAVLFGLYIRLVVFWRPRNNPINVRKSIQITLNLLKLAGIDREGWRHKAQSIKVSLKT